MLQPSRRLRRLWPVMATAMLAACVSATPATVRTDPPAGLGTTTGKTLFAIYLMGSDLEGTGPDEAGHPNAGAGTRNLVQFVKGLQGLTPTELANVDVYLAFGGSRRSGWEGMKVADLPMLIEDAADGKFGNGSRYLSADANVNMGTPQTLQGFLSQVRQRAADHGDKRVFVDLWDHGGAFSGYGQDGDPGTITVPQIAGAFDKSGLKADMIGFDACLMANLEVATVLKPYSRFLLASEELEPGHGWDYSVIGPALAKTSASTLDLAKAIVDGFIDSPEHQRTQGKTLSVVDLSQLTGVETAWSDLSQSLAGNLTSAFRPMLKSVTKARFYGSGASPMQRDTIDIVDFGRLLKDRHPAIASAADRVTSAVRQAVSYNRDDGSRANSFGLSIANPANLENLDPAVYNAETAPLPAWLNLLTRFVAYGKGDQAPPRLTDVETFQFNGVNGQRVRVTEDLGVLQVQSAHAISGGQGLPEAVSGSRLAMVMSTEAEVIDEANDVYFLPEWDGQVFFVGLGGGDEVVAPVAYVRTLRDGTRIYEADGRWNGHKALITFGWHPQLQKAALFGVQPYVVHNGAEVPSRDNEQVLPGDHLAFYYVTIDAQNDKVSTELGPEMTVSQTPTVRLATVSGQGLSFGVVQDLKGNVDVSSPQPYTP